MTPKFTTGKERLHISDKYLCNGHWLVTRDAAKGPMAPKAFKALLSVKNGSYHDGIANGITVETPPNMEQIIPKRDGYELLFEQAQGVQFRADTDEIIAYKFNPQNTGTNEFTIGVNPDYVPVMRMGYAFAKDALSPILILDGRTLNDNLVGIVMPMRLNVMGGK